MCGDMPFAKAKAEEEAGVWDRVTGGVAATFIKQHTQPPAPRVDRATTSHSRHTLRESGNADCERGSGCVSGGCASGGYASGGCASGGCERGSGCTIARQQQHRQRSQAPSPESSYARRNQYSRCLGSRAPFRSPPNRRRSVHSLSSRRKLGGCQELAWCTCLCIA